MRRLAFVTAAAAAGFIATGVDAQARPDFSGRWTTDPDPEAAAAEGRSAAPGARAGRGGGGGGGRAAGRGGRRGGGAGDMGSGWGSTISIAQESNRLSIGYTFFARGDLQPPLRFDYALDGSATTNSVMMGRGIQEQTSTAGWDGNRLVIRTLQPFTNPATGEELTVEVTRTLSLESPTSLVVETTRAGVLGGEASTVRTTYRKLGEGGGAG